MKRDQPGEWGKEGAGAGPVGADREQDNSRLEWPAHTGVYIATHLQRMTLYKKKFEACKVGRILLLGIILYE